LDTGLRLVIDSGLADVERTEALHEFAHGRPGVAGLVVALESIPDVQVLADIFGIIGPERAVFSLDLKQGRPVTPVVSWRAVPAEEIMAVAADIGFCRGIVLDLARVGMGRGTGLSGLCHRIRAAQPHLELIAGGGVRGPADLDELAGAGCDAALVASALYDGRLTAADIKNYAG
jgi:phosphoribosylformimino-5-aminoimidazole carboxamide ribotide isomerase